MTALERVTCQILPYSADPDFYQPTRIFHAWYGKSLLACLPLVPWRPLVFVLTPNGLCLLLLLLSLVSLYGSNLQASVQRHLYEPVTIIIQSIAKYCRQCAQTQCTPSKKYTPYNPTNVASNYINKGSFYSPTLWLQNKPLFI